MKWTKRLDVACLRSLFLATVSAVVISSAGCSGGANTYPVRGLVRFPDGKVLQEGSVEFLVQNRDNAVTARGEIGPDGSFTLGTFALDDGAVQGVHHVVVISDQEVGNGAERPGLIKTSRLHRKYRNFNTSDLEFTIHPRNNEIIIEVEYADDENSDEPAEAFLPGP